MRRDVLSSRTMNWLGALAALSLVACIGTDLDDTDLASDDYAPIIANKTDAPGWIHAPTLHGDTSLHEWASAGSRKVHSLWIAGDASHHVPLTIAAQASNGYDVRIAVLGPLSN